MKQKPTKKCENGVQLRPASIEEAGLFYSELDEKQDEALGTVGHIRMDFGILLQQQTYQRAQRDLCDFCVCDENDYLKFVQNNLHKPAVIVLKKNTSVLKQWKNNFSSTNFCAGNPLFIVDDEADAASLNTQVNRNKQSTINKNLEAIKKTTSSSIYMQVTGTPQSILLQTAKSGWKPYFIYYFRPGKGYMGGDFFFPPEPSKQVVFTDNDEAEELLNDDEFPENGLKTALIMHLISSGHINDIYPSCIENDERYSDDRHCCVAKEVSILIAEQI